jgi:hypothetical protein
VHGSGNQLQHPGSRTRLRIIYYLVDPRLLSAKRYGTRPSEFSLTAYYEFEFSKHSSLGRDPTKWPTICYLDDTNINMQPRRRIAGMRLIHANWVQT